MAAKSWTEADYDSLSWHDNHVHGLSIAAGENGTGTLSLDLDFILEWLPPVNGFYSFRIAPATLTFREVFGLKIDLDWACVSAGMTPFTISQIGRKESEVPGRWQWSIGVNWPEGLITFEAAGFLQKLRGSPVVTSEQCLTPQQRLGRLSGS